MIKEKYGRWTVLNKVGQQGHGFMLKCRCDCGTERIVNFQHLKRGTSKSCGCFRKEKTSEIMSTHRMSKTKLFKIWCGMKKRCFDKKCKSYADYGGRGIFACNEWLNFKPFMEWALANGYQRNLTIERIDNDEGYYPENCTFIPKREQAKNTRANRLIIYHGKRQCIAVWARELNIAYNTIIWRFNKGYPPNQCLSPVRR